MSIPITETDIPLGFEPLEWSTTFRTSTMCIGWIVRGDIHQRQIVVVDNELYNKSIGKELATCRG